MEVGNQRMATHSNRLAWNGSQPSVSRVRSFAVAWKRQTFVSAAQREERSKKLVLVLILK